MCTRINYKIIPVTNLNKYLHYGTSFLLFSWRYNPLGCTFHSPVAGFSLLIRGFLIIHNDAPQSVGLLWTSDQPVAETSTWQHTTLTTDEHPCPPVGLEPTISSGERPMTYALDRADTGTGTVVQVELSNMYIDTGANNGSGKLWYKTTATSGKLIYLSSLSFVRFCLYFCTS